MDTTFTKNSQYYKFCFYGFFKNLRFFDAFLVLFFLEKGLDFLEIGLLYSIREIAIIVLEIPSGIIADALGRRRTLITSFFVYILSFLVFYFSNAFGALAVAMILFAYGDAFRTGVHKAMIYHYLHLNNWGGQKISYYGHTRSWSQMGSALSSLIAGILVFMSGEYRLIFLYSTLPYLLDMALVYSYPKILDGNKISGKRKAVGTHFRLVINSFIHSFSKKDLLISLNSLSLYTGFYRAVKDYIQPLIKAFALSIPLLSAYTDSQKTAVLIGLFYFIIYLATAWASRNSGKFTALFMNAFKPMNISIIFGLSIGLMTGLFFLLGWYAFAVLGFLLLMMIENIRKPIGFSLVADNSKNEAMASVLSASSQAKSIYTALLAPLVGWIADLYSPGTSIVMVSVFLLLIFPLYILKSRQLSEKRRSM